MRAFKIAALLALLLPETVFSAAPNILSNTDHAVGNITAAISALGGSSIIDQTCATGMGSPICGSNNSFVSPDGPFIAYALNGASLFYSVGTASSVNHQPYNVLTESSTNYGISIDQNSYTSLTTNGIVYNMPHCPGAASTHDYPPVAMTNILPFGSPSISANQCGYDTGTEFSLSTNYLYGGSTSTPSSTAATFAGVLAKMKEDHPTWTWNDIKGALRQTASNWTSGYAANNAGALGFGNVSYSAATAVASTNAIYLQSPGINVVNHVYYATLTLYPFRQTRRAKEVVYIGGTWPAASAGNELTAAQIAAAGGTLVYTSNGTDVTPMFTYAPGASGTANFYALTLDASGNGSRIENFFPIAQSFVVGTSCFQ